jgi:hypothetical protein
LKYKEDPILLDLWLERIQLEIQSGTEYHHIIELFKQMGQLRIGLKVPDLYLAWAEYEHNSGFTERAFRIVKAAIDSNVQPANTLHEKIQELQVATAEKENRPKALENLKRIPLQDKSLSSSGLYRPSTTESSEPTKMVVPMKKRISRLGPPVRQKPSKAVPPSPESISSPQSQTNYQTEEDYQHESPNSASSFSYNTMDMDLSNTIQVKRDNTNTTICLNDTLKQLSIAEKNIIDKEPEKNSVHLDWPNIADVHKSNDKTFFSINRKVYMRSQLVGKGGSCKVFKILNEDGQVYALKKVKLRGQDSSVIAGYKNEIILLNKLKDNERIINLIDAEQSDGNLLMVLMFY